MAAVLQYVSYVSGVVIFMSMGRLFLFFKVFNIPIFNFIVFADILTYSLDLVFTLTAYATLPAIAHYILTFYKVDNTFINPTVAPYVAIGSLISVIGIYYIVKKNITAKRACASQIVILILSLVLGISVVRFYPDINQVALFFIILFWFLNFYIRLTVAAELHLLFNVRNNEEGVIEFNDGANDFEATKENFLIGVTLNFVFTYDKRSESYKIYSLKNIKAITNPSKLPRRAVKRNQTKQSNIP